MKREWDIVIVGAGPAGLFAALGVAAYTKFRVLVIDAGPDIGARQFLNLPNYLYGIGGAGLFSDGKLCLSLDVGGNLRDRLPTEDKARLMNFISATFGLSRAPINHHDLTEKQVLAFRDRVDAAGLGFKFYPVAHIGTDQCGIVISRLRSLLLSLGVTLRANSRLVKLERARGERFTAHVRMGTEQAQLYAEKVVLALGKVGSAFEAELCRNLGIKTRAQPMYLGARVESSSEALRPLFQLTKDPKLNLFLQNGTKVKSHCASEGGEVLTLYYDGLPLAGAHNYQTNRTGRSGFSILWNGIQLRESPIKVARELMHRINEYTRGGLLVQTLADYRSCRPSTEPSVSAVRLTNSNSRPGDLRRFLPEEFLRVFEYFLERVERLCPTLSGGDTVFYAPAIEWWMDRIEPANNFMETSLPGLYVAGDGSGWSQGIVHAAATGLLAAEGISGCMIEPDVLHHEVS